MPQSINPLLQARIETGTPSLCTLVSIERLDGVTLRYTSSTRGKTVDGEDYKAGGFTPTDIVLSNEGSGTLAMVIAFDTDITQSDIRLGKYDGALLKVYWADWLFPQYGKVPRFTGVITQSQVTNEGAASFSCDGQIYQTQRPLGEIRQPTCRARFGDERCKFPVADYVRTATVTAIDANYITVDIVDIAAADPQDPGPQPCWQVKLSNAQNSVRITQLEMRPSIGGTSYETTDGTVYDNKIPSPDPADPWNNEQWTGGAPAILGIELTSDGPVQELQIRCAEPDLAPTTVELQYGADREGPFTTVIGFTFTDLVWTDSGQVQTLSRSTDDLLVSYNAGILKFTSGENTGLTYDIIGVDQNVSDTTVRLAIKPTRLVTIGDTVEIYPGCDLTLLRCKYYANVVNMRAEPYVPTDTYQGQNRIL